MDDKLRKEFLREELKRRNKGKTVVLAKYKMKYPESTEREYIRLANDYMAVEKEVLMRHLPEMKQILNDGTQHNYNTDSKNDSRKKRRLTRFSMIDNTIVRLKILFGNIRGELEVAFNFFGLKRKLNEIAGLTHKYTIKEWKKTVSKTLNLDLESSKTDLKQSETTQGVTRPAFSSSPLAVNIFDDYYSGKEYKDILEKWVSDNVELIKKIPSNSLDKMKDIVYTGYTQGESTTEIVKNIQKQYGMDKRHARLIARDQTGKLNAAITKKQQQDAGIKRYIWSTSKDERVRAGDKMGKGKIDPEGDNHKRLEKMECSWDNPPFVDRKRKRKCHPGEDYQCRCCSMPIFDLDTLDLPI